MTVSPDASPAGQAATDSSPSAPVTTMVVTPADVRDAWTEDAPATESASTGPVGERSDLTAPERTLGVWTGAFVVMASMIGTAILMTSGYTLAATGQPLALLALWAVGGVLALCGAFCVAELGATLPLAGGDYVFVRRSFGPAAALVCGWATYILGFVGPTALMAWTAAAYLVGPFRPFLDAMPPADGVDVAGSAAWPLPLWPIEVWIAAAVIVVLTGGHLFGARLSGALQSILTVLKILLLVAYVVLALTLGRSDWSYLTAGRPFSADMLPPLAVGLIYVGYAYTGWNAAGYLGGEIRQPGRSIPRAVIGGVLAVTLLYLAMNLAYVVALDPVTMGDRPFEEIKSVAATAAVELFGSRVATVFSLAFGIGLLASVSAMLLAGSRVVHAMATDRLLPRALLTSTAPGRISWPPVLAVALPAVGLLTIGTFQDLLDFTAVGLTAASGLTIASVFAIRRQGLPRPFSMPLYPVPPLVYLALITASVGYTVTMSENSGPSRVSLLLLGAAFLGAVVLTKLRTWRRPKTVTP